MGQNIRKIDESRIIYNNSIGFDKLINVKEEDQYKMFLRPKKNLRIKKKKSSVAKLSHNKSLISYDLNDRPKYRSKSKL
jgi:hypothetical protein